MDGQASDAMRCPTSRQNITWFCRSRVHGRSDLQSGAPGRFIHWQPAVGHVAHGTMQLLATEPERIWARLQDARGYRFTTGAITSNCSGCQCRAPAINLAPLHAEMGMCRLFSFTRPIFCRPSMPCLTDQKHRPRPSLALPTVCHGTGENLSAGAYLGDARGHRLLAVVREGRRHEEVLPRPTPARLRTRAALRRLRPGLRIPATHQPRVQQRLRPLCTAATVSKAAQACNSQRAKCPACNVACSRGE